MSCAHRVHLAQFSKSAPRAMTSLQCPATYWCALHGPRWSSPPAWKPSPSVPSLPVSLPVHCLDLVTLWPAGCLPASTRIPHAGRPCPWAPVCYRTKQWHQGSIRAGNSLSQPHTGSKCTLHWTNITQNRRTWYSTALSIVAPPLELYYIGILTAPYARN